jgi:predicted ester cyclase
MAAEFDVSALLDVWTEPVTSDRSAADRFRTLYTDPVRVNGQMLTADDLAARAETLQRAIRSLQREILAIADACDRVAVAFQLSGRHVGPFPTAAGVLEPTGKILSLRVIDILTLTDGRISDIIMVADELGALTAIGAAKLTR